MLRKNSKPSHKYIERVDMITLIFQDLIQSEILRR